MLDKLASIVRERFRIQAKIKALTAEGRMQAVILLALVPFMFCLLMVIDRSYAQVLLERPMLLVATGVAEAVGALWIRKIVTFDY